MIEKLYPRTTMGQEEIGLRSSTAATWVGEVISTTDQTSLSSTSVLATESTALEGFKTGQDKVRSSRL